WSYHAPERAWISLGYQSYTLYSFLGTLTLGWEDNRQTEWGFGRYDVDETLLWREPGDWKAGLLHFALERQGVPFPETMNGVRFPHWLPVAVFGFVPAMSLIAVAKRKRRMGHGLCPACGYDLRATPEGCPECGHVPDQSAA
ncbi:MAG TPA: hypothetical protein VFB66_04600, partial [Tepidisphaeraceae bacterium]|nr:hypothetical protein [Tepidisphaeraceae bacterium]